MTDVRNGHINKPQARHAYYGSD